MPEVDQDRARGLALQAYGVMDTAAESAFDRVTALAAHICRTPIALITFIDDSRQWVKSCFGTNLAVAWQASSMCTQTIAQSEPFIVLDTHLDHRFSTKPLSTDGLLIRFYCGVALVTPKGIPIGALSVIDNLPRDHCPKPELAALRDLAGIVIDQLDHRRRVLLTNSATPCIASPEPRRESHKTDLTMPAQVWQEGPSNVGRLAQLGLWRLSPDRRIMVWSDEIYHLLGRARAEFLPSFRNCLAIVHPEDRRRFKRAVLIAGAGKGAQLIELRICRPDGRVRHIRFELCPAESGREQGAWFGHVQDVTDVWETQKALMRTEKLAILGQLTSGVAHDFNNILTVVTLNLEEVIAELPESDEAQGILIAALQAAQRGSDLTRQLLSYARQTPLRPKATSFVSLFRTFSPLIRRALGTDHVLRISIRDERCAPLVDASQLQAALLNIVLNAREAMDGGGEVLIEAASVSLPSDEFPVDAPAGPYAMISITDQGRGIEPNVLPYVFEPFYTTKGVSKSGLGLSMVEGFVGQSGGRTLVQSIVGEGTTIRLFLPVTGEPNAAPTHPPERQALLVEDQPAVLATVSRMFIQLGYGVTAVQDASAALSKLDAGKPFDVMFADVGLPGDMDGIALAKLVSQRAPSIRILLTSGCTDHDPSRSGLPDLEILLKPYKRSELLERLNGVMSGYKAAYPV